MPHWMVSGGLRNRRLRIAGRRVDKNVRIKFHSALLSESLEQYKEVCFSPRPLMELYRERFWKKAKN